MNYFNYFTEVEDRFRQARNSGMFMMSPLDWALVESWKDAGVPLEAVLKGIDRAFEKYHARRRRYSRVNSVAYCAQEVMGAAKESGRVARIAAQAIPPGFDGAELESFFRKRAEQLFGLAAARPSEATILEETASALESMAEAAASGTLGDLEEVEQRLSAFEDRVLGMATSALSAEQILAARREMETKIKPYRRKMTAEHIAMLEQKYLRRRALEEFGLSRLSLFYAE